MFLKTVPPVVAVHSEWKSGKNFSLPLCFNDSASDSDFASTSGTPIPCKVQMIIESLRSTQSSDMSDELPADTRHAGRKVKPRPAEAISRSRRTSPDRSDLPAASSDAGDGSDSDDSVDRGIEEAIQEYLKEKVDHKRKGEPAPSPVQAPKVQRRDPVGLDPPRQLAHSNSNKVLTASNHVPKGSKCVQPLVALKKKKKPSKENPFRKSDKALSANVPPPAGVRKSSSSCSPFADRTPPPLKIKEEEEESLGSSSDDGIEEAILRFQREHQEDSRSWDTKDSADSSSDDGIEEAIQHYQQEKQNKKPHSKAGVLMSSQCSRVSAPPCPKLSKKNGSSRKKGTAADMESPSASPKTLVASESFSTLPAHYLKATDDVLCPVGVKEPGAEQQIHSTLTVNTTAELMCAEAILDISKTVMPAAFESDLILGKSAAMETQPFILTALPPQQEERSDDSSVDSEDGIEQEIRKFLELKAKMHELQPPLGEALPPPPPTCPGGLALAKVPQKKKAEEDHSKVPRLSLSRKRKRKEEGRTVDSVFTEVPQLKPESDTVILPASDECNPIPTKPSNSKPSSPLPRVPEGSVTQDKGPSCDSTILQSGLQQLVGAQRNHSSDKSSSLDSDEDLDAAIKDLLKTKKRVKKKVRDMKLKARKGPFDALKKPKPNTEPKSLLVSKPLKCHAVKSSKEMVSLSRQEKGGKQKGLKTQPSSKKTQGPVQIAKPDCGKSPERKITPSSSLAHEDSSGVDSDDSIEQEIRRFLAEKAKVSNAPLPAPQNGDDGGALDAASSITGLEERSIKEEEQEDAGPSVNLPTSLPAVVQKDSDPIPASDKVLALTTSFDGTDGQLMKTPDKCLDVEKDRDTAEQKDAWHQNLFLMKPEGCGVSEAVKADFTDLRRGLQNRNRIPLREVISAVCPSPPSVSNRPLAPLSDTPTAAGGERPPSVPPENRTAPFSLHGWVKREQWDKPVCLDPNHPHPFPLTPIARHLTPLLPPPLPPNLSHLSCPPPNPSHLTCMPLPPNLAQPRVTVGVVRLRRDQAAAVTPAAPKTNPPQLGNRQDERERERTRDGVEEEEEEEVCIDETDVESGEERRTEEQRTDKRQQRPSHMCLSTSIDPGELLSPYIALDTEQRSRKFRHIQQVSRMAKDVKRKLQFVVSMPR